MNLEKNNISEELFLNYKERSIFFSDFDRRFLELKKGNIRFVLGWHSDLIEPHILMLNEDLYAVGIDQNFAIIDFKKDEILFSKKLDYNYCDSMVISDALFVATELIVYKIDLITYSILNEYDLMDIFSEFSIMDNKLSIMDMDGNSYGVSLS